MIRTDTTVELTVDKGLRVCCAGKFSAAVVPYASAACINHMKARILQEETNVYSCFDNDEKLAAVGSGGIVFTMKGHNGRL